MQLKNNFIELLTDSHVLLLLLLTLGALAFVMFNGGPFDGGLKFGIDFSGGVKIPILLQEPVDAVTMSEMIDSIQTRTRAFGLSEVRVNSVGDDEIHIEVPMSDPKLVGDIEKILSRQGVYQGIVDGKVAVSGDYILPDTVRQAGTTYYQNADWAVSFSLTTEGQKHFTQVVRGKGGFPLYMYLDRPKDAVIIISSEDLLFNATNTTSEADAIKYLISAINLEYSPLPIFIEDSVLYENEELVATTNNTKAIISENASSALKTMLKEKGFVIEQKTQEQMRPEYTPSSESQLTVSRWDAVGLKSAPILAQSMGEGLPSSSYVITGSVGSKGQQKYDDSLFSARETISVLKGGALPVQISLGSKESVPAKFGQEMLRLSLMGLLIALLFISVLVGFRYKSFEVVVPIIFVSVCEMILLIAIIGAFTIDLAAMAGLIAAAGVSVDAQVIITDEILKRKKDQDIKTCLDASFEIIQTNAAVAIVALLPQIKG